MTNQNKSSKIISFWIALTFAVCAIAFLISCFGTYQPEDAKPVVILLDPGHGGMDTGAISKDGMLREADANLAIALACYDELMQYEGVKVYLTRREMSGTEPKVTIEERVGMVEEYGADILISLHCNQADSETANGAEIFVSHSIYRREYNQRSTILAVDILQRFRDMGITIRGVKQRLSEGDKVYRHADGSQETGDYFGVISGSISRFQKPGILVEHGFVDGDNQYLTDPEWLTSFGKADAESIAKMFGLKRKDVNLAEDNESESQTDAPKEAEIISDSDLRESANVAALIVSLPFEITQNDETRLRSVWQGFESLSSNGRRVLEEDFGYKNQVDEIKNNLINFDALKSPIRIVAKDDAEGIVLDRINKFVRFTPGETPGGLKSKLRWQADSGMQGQLGIQIVDKNNQIAKVLATGCVVELIRKNEDGSSKLIESIACVLPGDIDGDGAINGNDKSLLEAWLQGLGAELALDAASIRACDVNGDGRVDNDDLVALEHILVSS